MSANRLRVHVLVPAAALLLAACGPMIQVPPTTGQRTAGAAGLQARRVLVTVKCGTCSKGSIANIEDTVASELERRGLATVAAHALIGTPSNKQEFSLGGSGVSSGGFLSGLFSGSAGKEAITFYDLPPEKQNAIIAAAGTDGRADVSVLESREKDGVVPVEIQLRAGDGALGERLAATSACVSYWTTEDANSDVDRSVEEAVREASRCAVHFVLSGEQPPAAPVPAAQAAPAVSVAPAAPPAR